MTEQMQNAKKRINAYMGCDVRKALESVQNEYDRVCSRNTELLKIIQDFRKDAELVEAEARASDAHERSLPMLTKQELIDYRDFRDTHYVSCKNSGRYVIELCGTGIGETITVVCPICGMSRDITDIDSW